MSVKQTIMPVICMSIGGVASYTRQTRSSMLEVIRQDYIRTARSKGLPEGEDHLETRVEKRSDPHFNPDCRHPAEHHCRRGHY